jgi:hypothetical protein
MIYKILVDYTLESKPGQTFRLTVKGKRETPMSKDEMVALKANIMKGAPAEARLIRAEVVCND